MADADARRNRLNPVFKVLLSAILLTGLALAAAVVIFGYGVRQLDAHGPLDRETVLTIERGLHSRDIAAKLEEAGVIANRYLFLAALMGSGRSQSLKAGEYAFAKAVTMQEVIDKLHSGKTVVHKLTIPEGLTSQQIFARVRMHDSLSGEITGPPPEEGVFLPDTYVFARGARRMAILERMRRAQTALLDEIWPRRQSGLPLASRREAVILASIVEKETAAASERARVAAVFINRLRKNMRLQSDPTVIYGVVGGKGRLERPIRRSDLDTPTPYNTYRIKGLPPTPIANPGRASLLAVLHPVASDELFFVANGEGGHAFAKTLEDHRANVANWRAIEKKRHAQAGREGADRISAKADALTVDAASETQGFRPDAPARPTTPGFKIRPLPRPPRQ